jgi:hypothetical protein
MKTKICLTVLFVLAALPAMATTACSAVAPANYAQLVALGATGCSVNDLLFSNFTFAGSATGTGTLPTASQMSYILDNPSTVTGNGQSVWGFEFNPGLAVLGIGAEDIQIQFDITAPTAEITDTHLLENAFATAGAAATATEGPDCGKITAGGGCTFLPTLTVSTATPHQDALGIGPYLSLHVLTGIDVISTSSSGFAVISDVRNDVDPAGVPEPGTFSYVFGAGLLSIGLAARKLNFIGRFRGRRLD